MFCFSYLFIRYLNWFYVFFVLLFLLYVFIIHLLLRPLQFNYWSYGFFGPTKGGQTPKKIKIKSDFLTLPVKLFTSNQGKLDCTFTCCQWCFTCSAFLMNLFLWVHAYYSFLCLNVCVFCCRYLCTDVDAWDLSCLNLHIYTSLLVIMLLGT